MLIGTSQLRFFPAPPPSLTFARSAFRLLGAARSGRQALAKARQRDGKKYQAYTRQRQQYGPDQAQAGMAKQNRLAQAHKMCGGRYLHRPLQPRRHAVQRRSAARQQQHRNNHRDAQQAELRN
jgi:hypothetical protein